MMNTYKKVKNIVIYIILFSLIMSSTALATTPDISNGFADDIDSMISTYANAYGWDTSLMGEYPEAAWIEDLNGKSVTFNRTTGYQDEYYEDIIKTTRQYLGLSVEMDGSGMGMVSVALSQLEANGNDEYFEDPRGSNNIKYNTWYYGHTVWGDSYPWCCVFLSWCAEQCGYLDNGLGIFTKSASCSTEYTYLTSEQGFESYRISATTTMGGYDYTPVPGDIMFFYNDESSSGQWGHVGIIVEVTDDGWYTVEGNSGNQVSHNYYSPSSLKSVRVNYGCIVHVEYPNNASQQEESIYSFLVNQFGYTTAAACGALGNMKKESDCISDITEYGYTWETGAGYGLIQWTNTDVNGHRIASADVENYQTSDEEYHAINGHRRTNLVNYCTIHNLDYTSVYGQLCFLNYEISTSSTYRNAVAKMNECTNDESGVKEATRLWMKYLEGINNGTLSERQQYAIDYWYSFSN